MRTGKKTKISRLVQMHANKMEDISEVLFLLRYYFIMNNTKEVVSFCRPKLVTFAQFSEWIALLETHLSWTKIK